MKILFIAAMAFMFIVILVFMLMCLSIMGSLRGAVEKISKDMEKIRQEQAELKNMTEVSFAIQEERLRELAES